MTVESPMLALCLLPVTLFALRATRGRWPTAGKWLLRLMVILLLAAIAGPVVRWERPLKIAVMVDVSPSTRGAAFRDEQALKARLTPLLAGRPYSVHYFADGEQPTAVEPPAAQTRLTTPADADAVLLLSDGRLTFSNASAPIYPIVDPSLDATGDAAVRSIRPLPPGEKESVRSSTGHFATDVLGQPDRVLLLDNGSPARRRLSGGAVTIESTADDRLTARLEAGDRWPENDALTAFAVGQPDERRSFEIAVTGFQRHALATLPVDAMSLVNVSAVAIRSGVRPSAAQERALDQYVRTLGGTLLLVGEPDDNGSVVEKLSPLSVRPVDGPASYVFLIDASGSMAGPAAGVSKWGMALVSAASAVDRLPKESRLTVLRFAGTVRPLVNDASPAEAIAAINSASTDLPSGRTGLRPALQAAADAADRAGGARVLLLTDGEGDLGETDSLAASFKAAKATLVALTANPSPDLKKLCQATGGELATVDQPTLWDRQFSLMAKPSNHAIDEEERLAGVGRFAGRSMTSSRRWPVSFRSGSQVLLTADGQPVAAAWQLGAGRVVAVAAMLDGKDLSALTEPFVQPAADPRYAVTFDGPSGSLSITAMDSGRLLNGLKIVYERNGASFRVPQVAPGLYRTVIDRLTEASVAMIKADGTVVCRTSIPGRYAREFDVIGNDRPALAELAKRTGGAVIEAGDNRAIQFVRHTDAVSLRMWLAALAAGVGIVGLFAMRFTN